MIIVGLTGGIGSGKTTVAKMFKKLGIPVYIADKEAKKLMRRSKVIKRKLIELFGDEAYKEGELNKPFIADRIFNDKSLLDKMNAIVHPRVAKHFKQWVDKQDAPYVIKEVAILFETGGYKQCDFVITVTAPKGIKMTRLMQRDDTSESKIEAIMKNQWTDDKRLNFTDFKIENINLEDTKSQVFDIHQQILLKI
ncbi:dephospho-CoA kinase [Gaetbulibacter aestuarii]|uniref:Dephospho-CoA kinase n=1 Tax=Gaetbulibacter aestuarii TaxID=1502358 RepID=A0ABW7N4W8_9FLAO